AYQQEFGYGVPQFRLMFHPLLIVLTASLALVAVRLACGAGAALLAAVVSIVLSGLLTVIVGPIFGTLTHHFPLYLAEAALVELAALALLRAGRSPYPFAALSALLIGTVGVVAEWGWSHAWMPLSWPGHLVGPAMLRAIPVALAGAVIAVFVTRCLTRDAAVRPRWSWLPAAVSVVVALALLGSLLPTHAPDGARVQLALSPQGDGTAHVTATFTPRDVAEQADWVQGLSWQHGDGVVTERLERVSEGVYRTTVPLQIAGNAKALIRLQRGTTTASVGVRLPADPAIPVGAIPARRLVERPLVHDPVLLQRERKPDTPRWLWAVGSSTVLLLVLGLFSTFGWALLRAARLPPEDGGEPAAVGGAPGAVAAGTPALAAR
ncbi:MAG TPA: hypothetical protein VLK58_00745, partial [Conexibacter sp.]|nr:hypothetical protein [Conexibacter sp.]